MVPASARTCKLAMLENVPPLQKISGLRHNFMDFDNFCWKMCGQTSSKCPPNLRRIRKLWKRLSRNCSGTFFFTVTVSTKTYVFYIYWRLESEFGNFEMTKNETLSLSTKTGRWSAISAIGRTIKIAKALVAHQQLNAIAMT